MWCDDKLQTIAIDQGFSGLDDFAFLPLSRFLRGEMMGGESAQERPGRHGDISNEDRATWTLDTLLARRRRL